MFLHARYGARADGTVRKRRAFCKDLFDLGCRVVRKAGCTLYIEMRAKSQGVLLVAVYTRHSEKLEFNTCSKYATPG